MLGWRLLVSSVLIPLLIGLFYADAKLGETAPLLLLLCVLLAIRGVWEMAALLRNRSLDPHLPTVALCTVAVVASGWVARLGWTGDSAMAALGPITIAFSLSVLLLLLKEAIRFREPGHSVQALGAELLIVGYVGVLTTALALFMVLYGVLF